MALEDNVKEEGKRFLVFTDLDDTLLDNKYEFEDAVSTLGLLQEKKIPLIFCSNKTYIEQNIYRQKMGVECSFIVEGGSAIYIPKGSFKERKGKIAGDYEVIVLGVEFEEIKKEIDLLRKKYRIKSYSTMSDDEVAEKMELDLESAKRAKCRQFTETVIEADDEVIEKLKKKFNVMRGGRALQVSGKGADKGKAVKILTDLYKEELGDLITIGLGNSYNDEAMLRMVDIPVLVKNPDGNWADITIDGMYKSDGIGPQGWSKFINKFVLGSSRELERMKEFAVKEEDRLIYIVPHTHYDAIWVFTKEDYFYINIDLILRKVIELLGRNKSYKFTIEQTYLLEEIEIRYPELFDEIAKYVKEGRIEIADGEYLMADTMLPNGETLIREIFYGKLYVKKKFGVDVPVMWQADSFGLNAQLPQIYKKSAYKYVAFRRGSPERSPSEFIWESLDGTRIIAHFMPLGYRAGMDLKKLEESYKKLRNASAIPHILMPSGSGVTMPQEETLKAVASWNEVHKAKMKIATPSEYFAHLKECCADELPVRRGEMFSGKYSEVFPDVASSRIWIKKNLRESENKLLGFEKFSTVNLLVNNYYPEELRNCWKKVMFLAFHDVVPGTGMDSGYGEVKQHISFLQTYLATVTPRILMAIAENGRDKNTTGDIIVFNSLSWDVSNWVEIELNFDDGQIYNIESLKSGADETDVAIIKYSKYADGSFQSATLGFVAHIPATGYKIYKISDKKENEAPPLEISGNMIENKFFKLHFNLNNGLIEIFKDGKKICGGNELILEDEVGDLYYHKEVLKKPLKTESGEGVKYGSFRTKNFWLDKSPLRVVINIETDYYSLRWPYRMTDTLKPLIWRHRFIRFKKQIIIYRDIPRVDFITRVSVKHPRIRLRVKFDTDFQNPEYTCETQFGAVRRKTDQYYFKPQGWKEVSSGVSPSINWIDYGDEEYGLTLINKGNPENEIRDGNIYLTLLRVVDMLSADGVAGPAIPVLEAREFTKYIFYYSLYPHANDWKTAKSYKHGHEFNTELIPLQLSGKNSYRTEKSFFRMEPDNVIICAVKKAENDLENRTGGLKDDNGFIVRFYEAAGEETDAVLTMFTDPEEVRVVNLMEEKDKELDKQITIEGNKIKMKVKPFEIVTLRIKLER